MSEMSEITKPISATPNQAMTALGIALAKLYEKINTGELESYVDGGSRKILWSSIHAYVERQIALGPKKSINGVSGRSRSQGRKPAIEKPIYDNADETIKSILTSISLHLGDAADQLERIATFLEGKKSQ